MISRVMTVVTGCSKVFTLVRTYYSHNPHVDFKRIFYHYYGEFATYYQVYSGNPLPYYFNS